ncbi:MAG: hypothetical protein CL763_10330 [Chloroflexi bacterium]|nr:hypothetical protein [Chloroflexota bacterium]|tara:strand:+ start:17143 stop:18711 length:1569 start_codon:yes stop_codon:yes gene_type:complete
MFAIFPVIFIYSQNIHLLPFQEILFPLGFLIGSSILIWFITKSISKNSIKSGLFVSLFFVTFFSYGHIYNLLSGMTISDVDLGRHRFLLIPFVSSIVLGIIFLLKTKRKLNNFSQITTVVSITIVLIAIFNVGVSISQENYFFSVNEQQDEKFLGVGASNESFIDIFSVTDNENTYSKKLDSNPAHPDIYYIILDEYGSKSALEEFFNYDNSKFLSEIKDKDFFIFEPSYTNYPTTVQSLSSSLNMKYINYLTDEAGIDSKNYHLLNEILSKNEVMKILQTKNYNVINMGALWGPNNAFTYVDNNFCEFKEFNRDSLIRELIQITMLSYIQERLVEQGRRDRVLCVFDEMPLLNEKFSSPKFVFAHIMLPHAPYIFGPNGEHITPGNSLNDEPWNPKNAHIDQIKFANKKLLPLIDKLLIQNPNSIIILQGDTGSAFNGAWDSPSDDLIIERMSNLNAIYFPETNYESFTNMNTPINTFRIIFNEYFDSSYSHLENKMYWSTGALPYLHNDVTDVLLKNDDI